MRISISDGLEFMERHFTNDNYLVDKESETKEGIKPEILEVFN